MKSLEIIGHRADHIRRTVEQVDLAISIKINRKLHPAAGHELRQTHRPRVAAFERERVGAGAVGERQKVLKLAFEKRLPLGGARVRGGEVKGQGAQGVDDAKRAGIAAIDGFHADDADDDLSRHAKFLFSLLQRDGIGLPKPHAGFDADRVDKPAAVDPPVFRHPFGRWLHQTADLRQLPRLANSGSHPVFVHVTPRGDVVGHQHGFCTVGVEHALVAGNVNIAIFSTFLSCSRRIYCLYSY